MFLELLNSQAPEWLWCDYVKDISVWDLRICQGHQFWWFHFSWAKGIRAWLHLGAPWLETNYFNWSDTAVDKSETLEPPKLVDDVHGSEIFEDELNCLYLLDFLHVALFEPVHPFLYKGRCTIISSRTVSDFLAMTFSVFSFSVSSIQNIIQTIRV